MNDLTIYPPDSALAKEIGQIIDNLRLNKNITQQDLANELGVTRTTYRQLVGGKAKLENVLGALRILGQQDVVDGFVGHLANQGSYLGSEEPKRMRASSKFKEDDYDSEDNLQRMVRQLNESLDKGSGQGRY